MAKLNELFRQQSSGRVIHLAPCAMNIRYRRTPSFFVAIGTRISFFAWTRRSVTAPYWRMEKRSSAFANSPLMI